MKTKPKTKLTLQRVFTKSVNGLAGQRWRRGYDEKLQACVYLASDGRRCAIGHVVSEKLAQSLTENNGGYESIRYCLPKSLLAVLDRMDANSSDCLGYALQRAHDSAENASVLRANLRAFAECNGLRLPKVLR